MKKVSLSIFSKILILLILLLYFNTLIRCSAQSDSILNKAKQLLIDFDWQQITDEENLDLTDEAEFFEIDFSTKININQLSQEQACYVLQLTDKQYYNLLVYIDKYGYLLSIAEILSIPDFDMETYNRVVKLVETGKVQNKKKSFKEIIFPVKQEFLFRYSQVLEKQKGYDPDNSNGYLGSSAHLQFRYKYNASNFNFAISGEKDAGEQFFKGAQKQGFDHYSYYLTFSNIGIIKKIVLGNFRVEFGQGLVCGSGLISGYGGNVSFIRKFPPSLSAIASMNENDAFNGLALSVGNSTISAILFYGVRFFDGNVNDTIDNPVFQNSLSISGLHRTITENNKKHTQTMHTIGANFIYKTNSFRIGLQSVANFFKIDVLKNKKPYQLFDFEGNKNFNISTDYQWTLKKTILFGEFAINARGYPALLQGIIFNLTPAIKTATLLRYYDKCYFSFSANAFSATRKIQNETGLYSVTDFIVNSKWQSSIAIDICKFPWLKYKIDNNSSLYTFIFNNNFVIYRDLNLTLKYSYKFKNNNIKITEYFNETGSIDRHFIALLINYHPFSKLVLKSHFNTTINNENRKYSTGYLFAQDINYSISKIGLSIKGRISFFDTDGYLDRLYAYEDDLLYVFNIMSYYYKGLRFYLVLQYKYKFIDFSVKYSITKYTDRDKIGSGNEEILKSRKQEIKTQILFRF